MQAISKGVADLLAGAGFGAATGPLVQGRDAILALYRSTVRIYDDGTPRTKHLVTNLAVKVGPAAETATSRSYFTVLQQVPDGPLGPIVSGRYRDQFVNHDGIWRFSERRIASDLIGDVSRHMLPGGLTSADSVAKRQGRWLSWPCVPSVPRAPGPRGLPSAPRSSRCRGSCDRCRSRT